MTRKEFAEFWVKKLTAEGIKIFPEDFLDDIPTYTIKIPAKTFIPGSKLFGVYEIITTDGEVISTTENYYEVKYYVYSSLQRRPDLKIPENKNLITEIVKKYERYIDNIVSDISFDFKKKFSDSRESPPISEILKTINLVRY